METYSHRYQSPFGKYILSSDGENLTGVWMDNQKYFPSDLPPTTTNLPIFTQVADWLDRYFAGHKPATSELPLAPTGNEFRQAVWRQLCKIPYGKTITYGAIARAIGCRSAQAVGGAVGHNPISIIIPCHRVIGTNGSLTGYAGGLDAKVKLLELEGIFLIDN